MSLLFLRRTTVAEHARKFRLVHYTPELALEGLVPGVDNLRHDVYLSPKFCESARAHLARLIARHGGVEDLVGPAPLASVMPQKPLGVSTASAKPSEAGDFKRILADVLAVALNRAKRDDNSSLDLLARVAIVKFLRSELQAQYADVLQRC